MKIIFLQVGKKEVFLELVQNLAYGLNVQLVQIFSIDQYIIQVYNNNNIQLFSQNLMNVFLKSSQSMKKAKKHDLIFEMFISDLKSCFLFIIFPNSYPIIGIGKTQLDKSLYLAKPIQQLANQRQQILVFDGNIIKTPIIYTKAEVFIWLLVKYNKSSNRGLQRLDKAVGQVDFDSNL